MRIRLVAAAITSLLCVISCSESGRPLHPSRIIKPNGIDQIILLDDPFNTPFPEDAVMIEGAGIRGGLLMLRVQYGGGCRPHEFALYGSGFMESFPVQVRVFLSHDANGDMCEALIREEIVFDLTPLKQAYRKSYTDNGPIRLRITEPGTDVPVKPLPLYEL